MSLQVKLFERCMPIVSVMDDCIISYDGALTVGWEVFPAEEYTINQEEYDRITNLIASAFRSLGEWTVVHRQDIYHKDFYKPVIDDQKGFLSDCYRNHFAGREFLNHRQFFWFTFNPCKSGKNGVMKGAFSGRSADSQYRPPQLKDFESTLELFITRCAEFIATLCSSGCFTARRVRSANLEGVPGGDCGLLERYKCWFGDEHSGTDISRVGGTYLDRDNRRMFSFSFSQSDDYPSEVSNTMKVRKLSSGDCDILMSNTSPIGGDLPFEHIVNQYYIFPNQQFALRELDRRKKNMTSMSMGSAENSVHAEGISEFIEMIHSESTMAVFSHLNVIVWGDRSKELAMRGSLGAALSQMGLVAKLNTIDMPQLFFAGFPGGACEVGEDNYMLTELTQAMCTGINESYIRDFPGGNLAICDRRRHVPVLIDTQQGAYDAKYIENYNAFILGPSGSGKSFFTNWYVRNCYDRGQSIFIIDKGDSYEGLTEVIREQSGGMDGVYYSWSSERPFAFAPFEGCRRWANEDEGAMGFSFVIALIKIIWTPERGWDSVSDAALYRIISEFIDSLPQNGADPIFEDFLVYLKSNILPRILDPNREDPFVIGGVTVTPAIFNLPALCVALDSYSQNGRFGFLLNDSNPVDLFKSRFVVFEVDAISQMDHTLYTLCTFCIIHAFERKMRSDNDAFRLMFIEEAWQAIASEATADYLRSLWKTCRKFHTSATVVTQQYSDISSSSVIKDAIVGNSPVKILLDQKSNASSIDQIVEYLGLSNIEKALVKSVGLGVSEGSRYKEVFISLGGKKSGVYALEVSPQEALVYESDKVKKRPLMKLAKELGSIITAVERLTNIA